MLPKLPGQIQILDVPPGTSASSSGGMYAKADASVTVRIDGDPDGVFQVIKVETADVETEPDSPEGHPIQVLQTALVVGGPGPIDVLAGQAIIVYVQFTCPTDPAQATFKAAAVMDNLATPNGILILAIASVGTVSIINTSSPSVLPGQTVNVDFLVSSSLGHDVNVAVEYDSLFEPHFTAPVQSLAVAPGENVPITVPVTCLSGTPAGDTPVTFHVRNTDAAQVFGNVEFNIKVSADVSVVTNLPGDFQLLQNDSVRCEIRVTIGGASTPMQFEVSHGPLPAGISISPDSQNITVEDTGFIGFDINAFPDAPLGKLAPLQIFWTLKEPQLSDQFVFNIEITQDIQEIIYSSGGMEAGFVRGWAELAIHKNGDWFYRGHVHENGVVGDNYAFAIAMKPADVTGDLLYAMKQGTLGGTVDPFDSRDDDWQQPTGNDPRITQNWDIIKQRGVTMFTSRLHVATDAIQVVELVVESLVAAVPAALAAAFLSASGTTCERVKWDIPHKEDNEDLQEIDPGAGAKVRCEGQ